MEIDVAKTRKRFEALGIDFSGFDALSASGQMLFLERLVQARSLTPVYRRTSPIIREANQESLDNISLTRRPYSGYRTTNWPTRRQFGERPINIYIAADYIPARKSRRTDILQPVHRFSVGQLVGIKNKAHSQNGVHEIIRLMPDLHYHVKSRADELVRAVQESEIELIDLE